MDQNQQKLILIGVDCIPSTTVLLIFVQEPTVIGVEELPISMDKLSPLDQQLSTEAPVRMGIDAQVSDVRKRIFSYIEKET